MRQLGREKHGHRLCRRPKKNKMLVMRISCLDAEQQVHTMKPALELFRKAVGSGFAGRNRATVFHRCSTCNHVAAILFVRQSLTYWHCPKPLQFGGRFSRPPKPLNESTTDYARDSNSNRLTKPSINNETVALDFRLSGYRVALSILTNSLYESATG